MTNRMKRGLTLLTLIAAACLAVSPVLADPPPGPRGEIPGEGPGVGRPGRGNPIVQIARLHMELGQYYLLDGRYDEAAEHFLAVTSLDVPEPAERPGRRGRRAGRTAGRAYLMAAVSLYLSGDPASAEAVAVEGQSLVPEERRERAGETPFDRFLADPESFCERFAGGAAALEARLLEIQAELRENGSR